MAWHVSAPQRVINEINEVSVYLALIMIKADQLADSEKSCQDKALYKFRIFIYLFTSCNSCVVLREWRTKRHFDKIFLLISDHIASALSS